MNTPRQSTPFPRRPRDGGRALRSRGEGGFALLVTIVLVAFLVLILVGLASFTRVETQVADNSQQIAKARQNALMALNIAIGQLQKHTGPDQRVTATADLQPLATIAAPSPYPSSDPASGIDLSATGASASARIAATKTALDNVDAYWRASRNRHWTGAWKNGNATSVSDTPDAPAGANPVAALQAWLVSGNENASVFTPSTAPAGLAVTSEATSDAILGASDADYPAGRPYRILVGKNTTGATVPADLDRFVTAPQVPIRSSDSPGIGGTSAIIGNYAWWIGDEGVKARANLIDTYSGTLTDEANRIRLQSAQRPALEVMMPVASAPSTDDERGLTPFAEALANNSDLDQIISQSQLTALENSPILGAQLKKRWHELSVTSRGVLADTKNGGLKHDLSYLLTRPDLNALRGALAALPGFAPDSTYNRLLSAAATPYTIQPPLLLSAFTGNSVSTGMDMFSTSATWEQLWSYHNMGNSPTPPAGIPAGVFVDATTARPRIHAGTQHGLYPLLVQTKLFYKLRMDGDTLDPDGVDRTSNIWIDIIPVVVLANPYSVDLEAQDYILRSAAGNSGRIRLYHALNIANPEAADLKIAPSAPANEFSLPDNGLGSIRLTIKAPRMEAGRAYVFTLENASTTLPPTSDTTAREALVINLFPDFNPDNVLTYNTGRKIAAAPATQAALTTDTGVIAFKLHTSDYITTPAQGDLTLIRHVIPHTYQIDSAGNTALVYPFSSNLRHGGGMGFFIHDASNVAGNQQNSTYQVNYRAPIVDNAAYTSFGANPNGTGQNDIAISFARTRVKNGASSLPGNDTANDFIQAHLLWRDANDPTLGVRWGIFNTGEGANDGTIVPASLVGDAGLENILYDVPRAAHPPASVSQLRHFNTAGYIPFTNWGSESHGERFAIKNHSFQPNLPIGNSYPNPMIVRHKVIDGDGGMGFQYDGSYLLNDALQDRFFFSTFPAAGSFDFSDPANQLINNRNRPFRSPETVAWDEPANFRSDSRSAAKNLLVDGAFNINSTSVEAWKALLSGLKDVPVGEETDSANLTAPFARTLYQTGKAANSRDGNTVNAWTGTINLTPAEVDALAREIVLQVRRRGPFLSMADFTNRRLIAASADNAFGLGLGGALQSAIDRIFNQASDVQPVALRTTSGLRPGNRRIAENDFVMPTGISGFSGYLLQADILSSIGAALSARSDTFTIRTYGDVQNPATGGITGRAWCEAIVQRTPDYVDNTAADATPAPGSAAEIFGRRYQIISFRWLSPEDI